MVLQIFADNGTLQQVGNNHFPKKNPGLSDEYSLEEYLSESQFSSLKRETIKFIYGDKCDTSVDRILKEREPNVKVDVNELSPMDGILYIQQGEMGIAYPHDDHIKYIGSSGATTCHLLLIRDIATGVCGVAHIDSVSYTDLSGFLNKLRNVIKQKHEAQPSARHVDESKQCHQANNERASLDLYIVGGYQDERGMSEKLSMALLKYFITSTEKFTLKVIAIGSLNTTSITNKQNVEDSSNLSSDTDSIHLHNAPILYGAATEIRTGRVFPATFPYRGPDETIRHLRLTFGARQNGLNDYYNCDTRELIVPAFSCNPHIENLKYYMELPDETFLQFMSTSPKVEPSYFIESQKKVFRAAIENPNLYQNVFPGRCNRVWKFYKNQGWMIKDGKKSKCKIIDQEDIEVFQQSDCDYALPSDG